MTDERLERLDPGDPTWTAFVARHPEATIFHHPAWAQAVAETYGLTPFLVAQQGPEGIGHAVPCIELRGLTGRRRWVALPFTDHCPVLSTSEEAAAAFVRRLADAAAAAGAPDVEVRAELPPGCAAGITRQAVRHVLRLDPDLDVLRAGLHPSQVRRNIRKAEREGVTVAPARERDALVETFYRLHARTRRRQGVPVQPRRFFERIWERLVEPGLGYVGVARHDGVPVAAALFLTWNETTVYKFGASDDRRFDLRANHALFWDAIATAAAGGRRWFDFGRTELHQSGLRAFKAGWGADELPLRYSSLGGARKRRSAPRGASLAAPVIRRSPIWVARALGAVSYRHAA